MFNNNYTRIGTQGYGFKERSNILVAFAWPSFSLFCTGDAWEAHPLRNIYSSYAAHTTLLLYIAMKPANRHCRRIPTIYTRLNIFFYSKPYHTPCSCNIIYICRHCASAIYIFCSMKGDKKIRNWGWVIAVSQHYLPIISLNVCTLVCYTKPMH